MVATVGLAFALAMDLGIPNMDGFTAGFGVFVGICAIVFAGAIADEQMASRRGQYVSPAIAAPRAFPRGAHSAKRRSSWPLAAAKPRFSPARSRRSR
ncbi:hypothetical protein [Brachybacterium sp. P6-10-X1]|uniref:hypothetical protein n=1 Tax=Brachybacterium sp. P6-10-X1 TaxID=1903186 RepID=UPI0012FC54FB|nr:hypothetical protein [Brachybacterium sp. P6-10-X1]